MPPKGEKKIVASVKRPKQDSSIGSSPEVRQTKRLFTSAEAAGLSTVLLGSCSGEIESLVQKQLDENLLKITQEIRETIVREVLASLKPCLENLVKTTLETCCSGLGLGGTRASPPKNPAVDDHPQSAEISQGNPQGHRKLERDAGTSSISRKGKMNSTIRNGRKLVLLQGNLCCLLVASSQTSLRRS